MFRTLSALLVFSAMPSEAAGAALKPRTTGIASRIEGVYTGTLFASGYDMPVETTFYLTDGQLQGEYLMNENGTMTPGRLTRIRITDNFTIECTWEDVYGTGPASFTFADDFTGFTGWWSTDSGVETYNWWGEKDPDQPQLLLQE